MSNREGIDTTLTEQQLYELENLIDARGIDQVLKAIAGIAGLKAEHIATNWQDVHLAKRWDKVARQIEQTIIAQATGL